MLERRARRWVAGTTARSAIRAALALNRRGYLALVNRLGEHYRDRKEVRRALAGLLALIRALGRARVEGGVSVKLSSLGVMMDGGLAARNAERLAREARRQGVELWLDAETHEYLPALYAIYPRVLRANPGRSGVTLLAYQRRSARWARALPEGSRVRLARGAYQEPSAHAYQGRREVTANLLRLLHLLVTRGVRVAMATHDERLLAAAERLARQSGAPIEFQFLKGLGGGAPARLARGGFRVYEYVPYGRATEEYVARREAYLRGLKRR
jgi:proline dehydrogenase